MQNGGGEHRVEEGIVGEYNILNHHLVRTLITKNFEIGQNQSEMAKGVLDFCKNLTSMMGPVVDTKNKENRELKRRIKAAGDSKREQLSLEMTAKGKDRNKQFKGKRQ